MQAVLTDPITTDYTPTVKPPWAVLALAVGSLALLVPPELIPFSCAAAFLAAASGYVLNRFGKWHAA